MICEKCGKEFFEDWRKDKQQRKLPMRFCSRSCATKRVWTAESNEKRSLKQKGKPNLRSKGKPLTEDHKKKISESLKRPPIWYKCDWCNNLIDLRPLGKSSKRNFNRKHFCNGSCRNRYLNANKIAGSTTWGCSVSKWEKQFQEILTEFGIKFEANKRDLIPSRLELDIWLPDYKTAIELNGIWHYSEKPYGDHLEKFEERKRKDTLKEKEVKELGYNFIIFKDDEIKDKEEFFRSFCKKLLE